MIVSPLLFKERMTLFQLLCFVMATAGLVLVVSAGNSMSGGSRAGIGFGLGAAVFYAAVVLMNKWSVKGAAGTYDNPIFGAVALLFVILMVQGGFRIQTASPGSIGKSTDSRSDLYRAVLLAVFFIDKRFGWAADGHPQLS